ncbi:MAG: VWA domain-containing protein [Oscillospiraceae bacterium]|nr:VWA domain-containing protein [Oscillospiraceae bacterium]
MKNNLTEMVFILDRSGSMSGLEADTIGGFNAMIDKQKKEEGAAFVTTVLFHTQYSVLHDRLMIDKVPAMTDKDYFVGGGTALLDAVGMTIRQIETIHKYARPEDVPAHTVFIITTDGQENSSTQFRYADVKKMIEAAKEKGWEFLYLGANIDAAAEAAKIGISRERAANYEASACGTRSLFKAMNSSVASVRRKGVMSDAWKDALK